MKYYSEHSKEYIESTKDVDMSNLYTVFEKYLDINKNNKLLDLGFGSGRDSLYFQSKGYYVISTDPTYDFYVHGKEIGLNVELKKAEEIDYINEFDGIWACASLLHVCSKDLNTVFKKCQDALKENGVMYCSFKYGEFEGIRNERYYTDVTEEKIKGYISDTGFVIAEILITSDVRPERSDKWLNIILAKT